MHGAWADASSRNPGPVVLAGHSYGGVVIANAATPGSCVTAVPSTFLNLVQCPGSWRPVSAGSEPSGTPAWKTIPSWAHITEANAGHLSLITTRSPPVLVTRGAEPE
ncbi:hypothetical protein [Streptomyces sp. NBC_01217]|uniref:hypothetical protein n=1 Tax=Streptomyces sp. NBC_01217 TaxID=2903779 RepID=UPI003FA36F6B